MGYTPVRRTSIAALVRMELARQKLSKASLSDATGISIDTLRRRLDGVYPFTIEEVDAVSHFLGYTLPNFYAKARDWEGQA